MTALMFRPADPADAGALTALLAGLSPDSAYLRFQTAIGPKPLPSVVRALLPEGVRGRALLGYVGDELVAHGVWVRIGPCRAAEIALVVADERQREGIGSALAAALLDDLAARGIERVEVFAGAGNRAVARMMASAAPEAERERDGATVSYSFAVGDRAVQPVTAARAPGRPAAA
ncbi:MAG: GNAT family N-acetyltransferase [Nocardioides sp.]|nr:GNAT family N-acetyltransferase [Nocardioidaceae bacterium]MCB8955579.1 GNAT family N-acetyltransferase [Nocardioides sp.]